MKVLLLLIFACSASLPGRASGIDGKWTSEREVGDADGKTYSHTTIITLRSDGALLSGTLVQISAAPWMSEMSGRALEITDGRVDGDKFSFRVRLEIRQGERSAIYEGTVTGDQLKGTIKYRGIGITQPFEAKRTH